MVLNYQTIFKANNGFELLNHVSSKQMVLNYQTIFKANNGFELLINGVRISFMYFRFAWSAKLVHVSCI